MVKDVFTIRDSKGKYFHDSYLVIANEGIIKRSFSDACNNPESEFYKHAEDFFLYKLGQFDNVTGQMISLSEPEQIAWAANEKEVKNV